MRNYLPLFQTVALPGIHKELSDEFLEAYRNRTELKLNRKKTVNRILRITHDIPLSLPQIEVFDKILGDTAILDKLIFVYDGSYRNNRIWCETTLNGKFQIHFELPSDTKHKDEMSDRELLNYMKNHFEYIFIHFSIDNFLCNGSDYESEDFIHYAARRLNSK